jgi:hypothetical protein
MNDKMCLTWITYGGDEQCLQYFSAKRDGVHDRNWEDNIKGYHKAVVCEAVSRFSWVEILSNEHATNLTIPL